MLSAESHHVGFAMSPARADARLHKLEFVSLAASKVMVIIVALGGHVPQKIVDVGEPLSPEDLRRAAEYVNREFTGMPLVQVRDALVARLQQDRSLYDRLMAKAFELASRSLADTPGEHTLFVEGAASLLEDVTPNAELPLDTLRALLQMMEEKQRLVRLLNEYLDGPGLTVVIGAEHTDPNLRPFSLVAVDLFGRPGHRQRWRDRADAHALLEDDRRWSTAPRRPSHACCGSQLISSRGRHAGHASLAVAGRSTKRSVMTEQPNETPALPQDGTPDPEAAGQDVAADDPVAQLKRERDEDHDRLLRLTAEFDNYRKRIERERRETSERAAASLLEDLLPIVDDLERALGVDAGPGGEAYRKGVEIIYKQLHDFLTRRGVTAMDVLGADFDPHVHQAVAHEPSPGARDGEVIEEMRRGYKLGDRLLRPAMVKVAKA